MIKVFLKEFDFAGFGYDVEVDSDDVTVGDYMDALNNFQNTTMADCRGCDGCCHERVPLIYGDYFLAGGGENSETLGEWLNRVSMLNYDGGAVDIMLHRRGDSSCSFLDVEKKECTDHLHRTFVCQTHCCLPKSQRALNLRGEIVNAGEDELVRRLLAEISEGKTDLWQDELGTANIADYAPNQFTTACENWQNVKLKDLLSAEVWSQIQVK